MPESASYWPPTTRSCAGTCTTGFLIRSGSSARGRSFGTLRFGNRGFVEYRDLAGLDGEELDMLIARQVTVFAARGEPFEWKLHGHDRPADLPERCARPGLCPKRRRPS